LAKIAVDLERALNRRAINGEEGCATAHVVAAGNGWSVSDVICTSGPDDRKFEERHVELSISIVAAGTFQYRSTTHKELLAPGSFLLGNPGQSFECGHDHGAGDRCIAFKYAPGFFETLVGSRPRFRAVRLPPLRASAPFVARACAAIAGASDASWEELAVEVAAQTTRLVNDVDSASDTAAPNAVGRVTAAIRTIERNTDADLSLKLLATEAGLSPYHFLRTFAQITGMTPHQFAVRLRLREAALRLALDDALVIDVALDCGFGDLSNFNRSFRTEFGFAPRAYRKRMRGARV
jgi:AraC-like DNA-binding protein